MPVTRTSADTAVVIPFGKLEGDIVRCVASALAQSLPARQVLVIANNKVSVDAAREKLAAFAGRPELRVIDGARCRNANDARNLGCQQTDTEWLALLDSDDWWGPDHLASSLAVVETAPEAVDFVYGSIRVVSSRGSDLLRAEHFSAESTAENYLLSYRPAQTSTYVVRRALMLAHPWAPGLRRHQDYEWFARITQLCRTAVNPEASVFVEWLAERRHKAHGDCWSVVAPWRPKVHRREFRKHHRNLIKSALRSRDPYVFRLVWFYAADALRGNSAFLRD